MPSIASSPVINHTNNSAFLQNKSITGDAVSYSEKGNVTALSNMVSVNNEPLSDFKKKPDDTKLANDLFNTMARYALSDKFHAAVNNGALSREYREIGGLVGICMAYSSGENKEEFNHIIDRLVKASNIKSKSKRNAEEKAISKLLHPLLVKHSKIALPEFKQLYINNCKDAWKTHNPEYDEKNITDKAIFNEQKSRCDHVADYYVDYFTKLESTSPDLFCDMRLKTTSFKDACITIAKTLRSHKSENADSPPPVPDLRTPPQSDAPAKAPDVVLQGKDNGGVNVTVYGSKATATNHGYPNPGNGRVNNGDPLSGFADSVLKSRLSNEQKVGLLHHFLDVYEDRIQGGGLNRVIPNLESVGSYVPHNSPETEVPHQQHNGVGGSGMKPPEKHTAPDLGYESVDELEIDRDATPPVSRRNSQQPVTTAALKQPVGDSASAHASTDGTSEMPVTPPVSRRNSQQPVATGARPQSFVSTDDVSGNESDG
uniref:hypothetical protein n=2 Tax=Pectobacterium versatile TaxID=2488639 RepID=UPI001CCAF4B1